MLGTNSTDLIRRSQQLRELWQCLSDAPGDLLLVWDLATIRAVKHAPHGKILGNVLELMFRSGSYEEEVA